MALSCRKPRRQIRNLFVGGELSPGSMRRLWSHLRTCTDCRNAYDKAMRLDRAISCRDTHGRTPSSIELGALVHLATAPESPKSNSILDTLSDMLALRTVVPTLSVCALLITSTVLLWPSQPDETWTSRSLGSATLAVRAFCETRNGHGEALIRSISDDPGPEEVDSCSPEGTLRFAVISELEGFLYAVRWEDGAPYWLVPEFDGAVPLRLDLSQELVPIPVDIGSNLLGSRELITVSFVRTPSVVSQEMVGSWLEGVHAKSLPELPTDVAIVERRVRISTADSEEGE